MKSWPVFTLRVFGALHVVMALLGIGLIAWDMVVNVPWELRPEPAYIYALQFCMGFTIVDLLCVVFLIRAGVALWRLESRGRWLSNAVLGFEVIRFLVEIEIQILLPLFGRQGELLEATFRAALSYGQLGTILQTLTGYPLIALLATNVAYRKLLTGSSGTTLPLGKAESRSKSLIKFLPRFFGLFYVIEAFSGLNTAAIWFHSALAGRVGLDDARPYMLSVYRAEALIAVVSYLLLLSAGILLLMQKRSGLSVSYALRGLDCACILSELGLRFLLPIWGGEATALANSLANSIGSLLFILPLILYLAVAVFLVRMAFRKIDATRGLTQTG